MRHSLNHIFLLSVMLGLGWSCAEQPAGPEGPVQVDVVLGGDGQTPGAIVRFLSRFQAGLPEGEPATMAVPSGISGSAAIDEAQIVVLDFTRWDTDAAALSALDKEPDSLYDAARFDIRRDIWDNLVAAFKAYRGTAYRFAGQYPLTIKNGAARGIIGAPPGFNLFFATLRSNKRTVYLYSALALVIPGQRSPITLFETTAEGAALNNIALWTGDAWVPIAGGMNGPVFALASDGVRLYAGGRFTTAGTATAANIAMFDGSAWRPVGAGTNDSVTALTVGGPLLYAGGSFTRAGGSIASRIAAWNGTTWSPLGTGVDGTVMAMAADTASLIAGGTFATAGGSTVSNIARWNGSSWTPLGSGLNGGVRALTVIPGNGAVVAGGDFSRAGIQQVNGIAAFTGGLWNPLGSGIGTVLGSVQSLLLFGGDLYAGGRFASVGGIATDNVAIWRATAWTAAAGGLAGGGVHALATDGTVVVAGGDFTRSGLVPIARIAVRLGGSWLPFRQGLDGPVHAVVFHNGALIAGGEFGFSR